VAILTQIDGHRQFNFARRYQSLAIDAWVFGRIRNKRKLGMKQVMIERFGDVNEMKLVDIPVPHPAPGEARVKIQAAGASYPDVAIRNGSYPEKITPPVTLGYNLVGGIDELGDTVTGFEVGQTVAALTMTGGYADYAVVSADELIPVPPDIDPAVASLIPLNYLTAYQMLVRTARVQKGQTVLIHSAAGGVGTAMLEICRHLDVRALGTASAAKHSLVRTLGGEPIDYQTTDFVEEARRLTDGMGVDFVFDPIGGEHFWHSFRALKRGGHVVIFGQNNMTANPERATLEFLNNVRYIAAMFLTPGRGVKLYRIRFLRKDHPEWYREDMATLFEMLRVGSIHPVIAARLPLEEAKQAHQMIESRAVQGAIVLTMS
jgi:NADPH:quinone reductase-like Zn-dependent oxidoreductase